MTTLDSVIAAYDSHQKAEEAIKELQQAGIDMRCLSIIGKDTHTDEHVVGYYNVGDRMKYWGEWGAFWGGLWGMLVGSAFFAVPGIGSVLVGGPLVAWIIAGLEGAGFFGGISAIGAGLFSIGIPKDSIVRYEVSLKTGKFLLMIHGSAAEVRNAKEVIAGTSHSYYEVHGGDQLSRQSTLDISAAPSRSETRLQRMANESASRGTMRERHFDEDHSIFTK